jgi:hypothetical protein
MTERAEPGDSGPASPAGGSPPPAHGLPAEDADVTAPASQPRDAGFWAAGIDRLTVKGKGPRSANVAGRRLTGPVQGFGKMWQKTYRMEIGTAVSPQAAIAAWKEHFAEFWPKGSRFEAPLTGILPGEVALLDVGIGGGMRLSTGVFVLYADEESFTLMTPQGHIFAGWITFSAERASSGDHQDPADWPTAVQAQVLMRANDPIYELAMALGGHRKEDRFWVQTMTALAKYLGAPSATVHARTVCIDPRRQWSNIGETRYNSFVRSMMQTMTAPFATLAQRRKRDR